MTFPPQWFLILQILKISLLNSLLPSYYLGTYAHSTLWGCSKTDLRGKMIEDLLLKHNLSILNDGSYCHQAASYGDRILRRLSPRLLAEPWRLRELTQM